MSRRLVIAIDCDDVLIGTTHNLVDTYNKLYGTSVQIANAYTSNNPEWGVERDELFRRFHGIQTTSEYAQARPAKKTIEIVTWLSRRHDLHIVTARPESVMDITHSMVDKYFHGCFKSIHHVGADNSKGEVCEALGADILIDDNLAHLVGAAEYGVATTLWFGDYPWQQSQDATMLPTLLRCPDWQSVKEQVSRIAKQ